MRVQANEGGGSGGGGGGGGGGGRGKNPIEQRVHRGGRVLDAGVGATVGEELWLLYMYQVICLKLNTYIIYIYTYMLKHI